MSRTHRSSRAALGAAGLLLSFSAAAHAGAAPASFAPATNSAFEFEIIGGTLENFDGGTLSVRRRHGEHAVWRLGFSVQAGRTRGDQHTAARPPFSPAETATLDRANDLFDGRMQITRLSFPRPEARLRPWYGVALGGGWRRSRDRETTRDFDTTGVLTRTTEFDATSRGPTVYLACLAGLEWAISPHFAIHAQYGQGGQFRRLHLEQRTFDSPYPPYENTSRRTLDEWRWYNTGARAGIAVFY